MNLIIVVSLDGLIVYWLSIFPIDHLSDLKMGLLDYISREPLQKSVNLSTYDEQYIVAKLDAIKRNAGRFLLNTEKYTDFA